MKRVNPHDEIKDSNPSPGVYFVGISEYYKADESKKQEIENLKMQVASIELSRRQQLLLQPEILKDVQHCIQALKPPRPSFKA